MRQSHIGIVVGDFEDIVLRGLRSLIEGDESLKLLAEGVPAGELENALGTHSPEVALLNYGSFAAATSIRNLATGFPLTRLVLLANRPTAAEARQLLSFGATACLSKSSEARDVMHAIHLASRGMNVMPAADAESLGNGGPELLSSREAQVLEQLQTGSSNGEIAASLHLSVETVRTHARNIYRKLGVGGRRELLVRR